MIFVLFLVILLIISSVYSYFFFFFFLMIRRPPRSTLSLHDALPISCCGSPRHGSVSRFFAGVVVITTTLINTRDRKSTRLNSSHSQISYAVFCLKKKKKKKEYKKTTQRKNY